MQSSKPSKKSVKKKEERASETAPVSESPKTRSRSSKAPQEKAEATSAMVHRKSPAASTVRVEANDPGPAKAMAAAAGAGAANGGIVDSVGVVAASPIQEVSLPTLATQSKAAVSREEIARLAYSYWESRGFSHGLADEDWIRAEAELLPQG